MLAFLSALFYIALTAFLLFVVVPMTSYLIAKSAAWGRLEAHKEFLEYFKEKKEKDKKNGTT